MQLFVIVFDIVKTAIDFGARLATLHRASSKPSTDTATTPFVSFTTAFDIPSHILSLYAKMEGNFSNIFTYLFGTLVVLIAALLRSQGTLSFRFLHNDKSCPAHLACSDTNVTADTLTIASASTSDGLVDTSEALAQTECRGKQPDDSAQVSDVNCAFSSVRVSETSFQTERYFGDAASVGEPVACISKGPAHTKYKGKQSDERIEYSADLTALTVAGPSKLPAQTECSDSDSESVADSVVGTSEAFTWTECGNEQSDEDHSDLEQMQEPIKRRRPTRRGGKRFKKKTNMTLPLDSAERENPETENLEAEILPRTSRKTRRGGRAVKNKKLLEALPTLDTQ
ncbi:hypothetical protein LPJ73_001859 [Coemansia sp. RSA 2703]|nr:hypothetical protein LPJ73_001859 [Coemansia sp. RSA 2703]